MRITIKKLGMVECAAIDLADLTILCGNNNTGKTYITYALYGFLKSWRVHLKREIRGHARSLLVHSKSGGLDLHAIYSGKINAILNQAAASYSKSLSDVFASSPGLFEDTTFEIDVGEELDLKARHYEEKLGDSTINSTVAVIKKESGATALEIVAASESGIQLHSLIDFVLDAISEVVFAPYFSNVFIASAERTGAAIFRKELDFARTRLLEAIGSRDRLAPSPQLELMFRRSLQSTGYPWPVRDNVEFVRRLEEIDKQSGELATQEPSLLVEFEKLIGGVHRFDRSKRLHYVPSHGKAIRLSMSESSSSVRALLDVGFYLRCSAKPGDLLMIDEPELNLHPATQRLLARLLSALVRAGLRVFITTHSDYIIKELNTLMMLRHYSPAAGQVRKKYQYGEFECLDSGRVKLYFTRNLSASGKNARSKAKRIELVRAPIHDVYGIEVESFDQTINEMNSIQAALIAGL